MSNRRWTDDETPVWNHIQSICRDNPGQWFKVRTGVRQITAHRIRHKGWRGFLPVGDWQAKIVEGDRYMGTLLVRYQPKETDA